MEHLTLEEIIEFVAVDNLDTENLDLIAKVGYHTARCEECDKMVAAVKTMHEEFVKLGKLSQSGQSVLTLEDLGLTDLFNDGEAESNTQLSE